MFLYFFVLFQPEDIDAHKKKFDDLSPDDAVEEEEEDTASKEEEGEEEKDTKAGGDGVQDDDEDAEDGEKVWSRKSCWHKRIISDLAQILFRCHGWAYFI